jgi:hypothetical protein
MRKGLKGSASKPFWNSGPTKLAQPKRRLGRGGAEMASSYAPERRCSECHKRKNVSPWRDRIVNAQPAACEHCIKLEGVH